MPIMDGLELIKNIYFTYPSIKVIILSGFNEFEFARQAIQYGVNDYLLKPVTTEQLSAALTKIKLQFRLKFNFTFKPCKFKVTKCNSRGASKNC